MANDASNRSGTTDRSTGPDKIGVYDRSDTRTSGTTTGTAGTRSANTRWIILAIIAVLVILALVYIL